jgi:hypothetical protein
MSIHPGGKSCRHLRSQSECSFVMALLPGAHGGQRRVWVHAGALRGGIHHEAQEHQGARRWQVLLLQRGQLRHVGGARHHHLHVSVLMVETCTSASPSATSSPPSQAQCHSIYSITGMAIFLLGRLRILLLVLLLLLHLLLLLVHLLHLVLLRRLLLLLQVPLRHTTYFCLIPIVAFRYRALHVGAQDEGVQ